jgi:hypothetical protein
VFLRLRPRHPLFDRSEIEALRSEKAELEVNIAALTKRGRRFNLFTCDPDNRVCVQITTRLCTASGQTDFQGAWMSINSKRHFAIPLGY